MKLTCLDEYFPPQPLKTREQPAGGPEFSSLEERLKLRVVAGLLKRCVRFVVLANATPLQVAWPCPPAEHSDEKETASSGGQSVTPVAIPSLPGNNRQY